MPAFFTAPAIAWGAGAVEQLSGLETARAFVVVDPGATKGEAPVRVAEELAKSPTTVETAVAASDPDHVAAVRRLAEQLRQFAPDLVVAVGGGRTLDGAKAARLLFERPDLSPTDPPTVVDLPGSPRSRFVAVPTTSGSGADASWTVDLVDEDGGPRELAARALVPSWSLVDARLAASLPAAELITGALETAAQAAEAFLSAWANPFSDALALDAVGAVVRRLPRAVRWSDDPEARAALHYAATSAGLAASNAQRGLSHALARALVGPTGLPYGRLVGLLLPQVLEFDRPGNRERLALLDAAVALPEEGTRPPLSARLGRLFETLRLPADLLSAGVAAERIDPVREEIVAHSLRSPAVLANPRVPTADDVRAILDRLLGRGGR